MSEMEARKTLIISSILSVEDSESRVHPAALSVSAVAVFLFFSPNLTKS